VRRLTGASVPVSRPGGTSASPWREVAWRVLGGVIYAWLVLTSSQFPYQRILEELRGAILSERIAPGEQLPSENELAERYGTTRPTVRRAIALLKAEGLVQSEQGRGVFARPRPHVRLRIAAGSYLAHRRASLAGFNAQVVEQGQSPRQHILEVGTVPAPDDVADRLDVDSGSPVVVRRRLMLVDGEPVARCDSYYPLRIAAGTRLAEPGPIRGGAYGLIEDPNGPIGRELVRTIEDLVSRMPLPAEAEQLRLRPGVPVVRILRTAFGRNDVPLEVQETVAAADKHEFRYEVGLR
jgi:GntR family transcriptional regulator